MKRFFISKNHILWSALTLTLIIALASVAQARKPGLPGESEIAKGDFAAAVEKLDAVQLKGADEFYLLGLAHMKLGQKAEAHKAWKETLLIDKKNSKRKRWTFLFPPKKKLKGTQKKKLKDAFEDEYRELSSIVTRMKTTEARDIKNKATRTRIDATRKDAKEKQLNKQAVAKGKAIQAKQKVADRKAKSSQTKRRSPRVGTRGGMNWGYIIGGTIIFLILIAIIFGRRSGGGGGHVSRGGGRQSVRYHDVGHDNQPFRGGPFYARGRHFRNQDMYHSAYGHYYSNQMYRNYYDRWGQGQAYDEALDQEIMHDIDSQEALYNEAAQEGYEADMMRADADHLDQDAVEIHQDIAEEDEALSAFDDEGEFADDEGEFEDDAGEFEDDDDAHSDGDFSDDGGYDDGGYDDGGYDDGGFSDDS